MKPEFWIRYALEPALELLPATMDTKPARAMVMAASLQESGLEHRYQIGGPARGYGQFEKGTKVTRGGITGVLMHPASKPLIRSVLIALDYDKIADDIDNGNFVFAADACYIAIEHNDILGAAFARTLLYTLPQLLPVRGDPQGGWEQYLSAWRPGLPRREPWNEHFANAWEAVS